MGMVCPLRKDASVPACNLSNTMLQETCLKCTRLLSKIDKLTEACCTSGPVAAMGNDEGRARLDISHNEKHKNQKNGFRVRDLNPGLSGESRVS